MSGDSLDKLELLRLTIDTVMLGLSKEEKLCVLTDMVCPIKSEIRWYGLNGSGSAVLEQGIYSNIITFRRVAFLWGKLVLLAPNADTHHDEHRKFLMEEARRIKHTIMDALGDLLISIKVATNG